MTTTFLRRTATLGAAATIAVTGAALTDPAANAETVGPATGSSNSVDFKRSVSGDNLIDGKVKVGDTITITNQLNRKLAWLVYYVKDHHPTCMEAVPQTSVWKVSGKTYTNNPDVTGTQKPAEVTSGNGWVQIKPAGSGSWEATPLIWTQDYKVTCDPGTLNTGGLEWDTTNVGENNSVKKDVGPTITVIKTDNGGGDNGGGNNGGGDNGGGDNGGGDNGGGDNGGGNNGGGDNGGGNNGGGDNGGGDNGGGDNGGGGNNGGGNNGGGSGSLDTGSLGSLFG